MKPCPARKHLRAYEAGELTEAHAEPIQRHLESCAACRALMDRIRAANRDARTLRLAVQASHSGSAIATQELGLPEVPVLSGDLDNATHIPGHASPKTPSSEKKKAEGGPEGRLRSSEWIIPDYERVRLCGEGSYGSVWAVRDRVGVYRALKIIDLDRMTRAQVGCRERTALETYCRRIARHPNLITVFHVGMAGNLL